MLDAHLSHPMHILCCGIDDSGVTEGWNVHRRHRRGVCVVHTGYRGIDHPIPPGQGDIFHGMTSDRNGRSTGITSDQAMVSVS